MPAPVEPPVPPSRRYKGRRRFGLVHKGPGDKAALLIPLGHLFPPFHRTDVGQAHGRAAADCLSPRENQRGKPFHLTAKLAGSLIICVPSDLAPFAPQLLLRPPVQHALLAAQPQVATFTLTRPPARGGRDHGTAGCHRVARGVSFCRIMPLRIAFGVFLTAQTDLASEAWLPLTMAWALRTPRRSLRCW